MRTHILSALMALIFTACASHHRDVASVNEKNDVDPTTGRSEHAVLDGVGNRGSNIR